jgi:hypothetical protein
VAEESPCGTGYVWALWWRIEQRLNLRTSAFVPEKGSGKSLLPGRNLHDHLAAASHANGQPRSWGTVLRRTTRRWAASERLGMETLRGINRRSRELREEMVKREPGAEQRMTFGIYFYSEAKKAEPSIEGKT